MIKNTTQVLFKFGVMLFVCTWLSLGPLAKMVLAEPLSSGELQALNEWPNWVAQSADACGGDGTASGVTLSGGSNGEKVFNYFTGKDLSSMQAAAITGNLQQESNFSPTSDNGQGYHGLGQWGSTRWTKLQQKPDYNKLDVQLDYMWEELSGSYRQALSHIKKSTTLDDAVFVMVKEYEVAVDKNQPMGVQDYAKRLAYAKQWEKKAGDTPGATPAQAEPASDSSGCASSSVSGACSIADSGQYSEDQLKKIFGDPGTDSSHPEIQSKLKTVDFNGNSVHVHSLAAGCLESVAAEIKSKNISYTIKQMGCYRYDSSNGSSNIGLKSYHTYGAACDINWDTNPWSGDGSPKNHDMPTEYIDIFKSHGFTWGGDWHSVKDYMHFEYHGIKPS